MYVNNHEETDLLFFPGAIVHLSTSKDYQYPISLLVLGKQEIPGFWYAVPAYNNGTLRPVSQKSHYLCVSCTCLINPHNKLKILAAQFADKAL